MSNKEIMRIEKEGNFFKLFIGGVLEEKTKAFKPYHLLNKLSAKCSGLFNTDTDEFFEQEILGG